MQIKIKKINYKAQIPTYGSKGAAGFDFYSTETSVIQPGETQLIRTGIAMEIPEGYELQVRPRSGMSLKTKIRVANSPGTIDSDYRGEIGIILENIGKTIEKVEIGDRIAQGVLNKIEQAIFLEEELTNTERGEGGYGSTGK